MASDDRDGLDPVLAILKKEMAENPEISKALGGLDVMNATEEDLMNLMTRMQDMMMNDDAGAAAVKLGNAAMCQNCEKSFPKKMDLCGRCKTTRYCGSKCTADWPRHKAHCKALAAQNKMQQESLKSFPKGIHRDAGQRIEQWIRLGMTELDCAITSAEHCLLTPPESLSTSHTFSVVIDYHPEVEDDSLCFTIKQINLMPNDVISELMERPVEDRQAMADLAMKTGKVHNSRFVHAFFVFGDDGMYFLPFPIQADRKAERELGKVCGAPDWWKDENWEANLLRRLKNSAFAKEGKGMPERFPTHLKDW